MTTDITAIIAEDTRAGNSQSMLCAGERTSAMEGARERIQNRQAKKI